MKAILVAMLCNMVRIASFCVWFELGFGVFYNFSFKFWGDMLKGINLPFVLVESIKKTT